MAYVMLSNLQVKIFFIYVIVKCFKTIFVYYFIMNNIVVYHTIIILNTWNKVANYMKLRVVKDWLT